MVIAKDDDITIVTLPIAGIEIGQSLIEIPQNLRYATELRKREYIAGRLSAQEAIERITGQQIAVGRDESGLPVWPQNIVGSISHSASLAGAAIAHNTRCSRLGIDIEEIVSNEHVEGLLSICASPEERMIFMTAVQATVLFAAKEAFFKAFYTDLQRIIEFTDVYATMLPTDDAVRITTKKTLGSLPLGFYVDVQVKIESGLVVSVCAKKKSSTL